MDLLRLPPTLRRSLLTTIRHHRPLSTHLTPTAPHPPPSELLTPVLALSSATLNAYTTTVPPTKPQLKHAHSFFASTPPNLLFSAAHFRQLPPSSHPEICFLGRSNVGKSSLLNALFNTPTNNSAYVSKKPGKTRTMNGFGIGGPGMGAKPKEGEAEEAWRRFGAGGMIVLDMPGYGGGSRGEWGEEVMKYLEKRKQLRRTFVLVDAEHGLKSTDLLLLTHLRRNGIPWTVVLSKVDKLIYPRSKPPGAVKLGNELLHLRDVHEDVRAQLRHAFDDSRPVSEDILSCSAEKSLSKENGWRSKLGVDEVRFAALSACGLESDLSGLPKRRVRMQELGVSIQEDEEGEGEDAMERVRGRQEKKFAYNPM